MIEERWTKSKISDIAKYLAIQESRNKDALVCRCTFHFGTSFRPATKDEIIKNTCKKAFTTPYRERGKVPAEAYHMGKWLGYTVELSPMVNGSISTSGTDLQVEDSDIVICMPHRSGIFFPAHMMN